MVVRFATLHRHAGQVSKSNGEARCFTVCGLLAEWDYKSDSYIAVLTDLATAFFLLGLAQSAVRMRLFSCYLPPFGQASS